NPCRHNSHAPSAWVVPRCRHFYRIKVALWWRPSGGGRRTGHGPVPSDRAMRLQMPQGAKPMDATISTDAAMEKRTMPKVYLRLLPFVFACYFLCYLDRINVGFAALTMNKDLGLDPAIYGMAAGAFFWGYFLFEVPSNLILEKIGARI